ncbi:MAG: T9SS type A sorting domain-containing protein [Bacteroidota bacterium]
MRIGLLLFSFLLCLSINGQIIAVQDFDGGTPTWSFTPSQPDCVNNGGDSFGITDASDLAAGANNIDFINITNDFFFVRDLQGNCNGNSSAFETLTFTDINLGGASDVVLSFDYDVEEYDSNDDVKYQIILDGSPQGEVILIDGVNGGGVTDEGTVTENIPNGTGTVGLILSVRQNGGTDFAGFDNFKLETPVVSTCDITAISLSNVGTCDDASTNNDPSDDFFVADIVVTYVDAPASGNLVILGEDLVGGTITTPITSSPQTISNVQLRANGTDIELQALFDQETTCTETITIVGSAVGACSNCGINIDFAGSSFSCVTETAGVDNVIVNIAYTGFEPGLNILINPPLTNTGDDPTSDPDGMLEYTITEGVLYTVTVSSADCGTIGPVPLTVSADFCTPPPPVPDVLITEIGDLPLSGTPPRYVEICNRGVTVADITGWQLERYANAGTTPAVIAVSGTVILSPGECYVFGNSQAITNVSLDFSNCVDGTVTSGSISGNGDDTYALSDGTNIVDIYGEVGTDGTGEVWEYENGIVIRNNGVVEPSSTLIIDQWTFIAGAGVADATPCIDDISLPVSLASLNGRAENAVNVISWRTLFESSNDYFSVERSTDGRTFSTIGQIAGAGNSDVEMAYQFIDEQPLVGRSYYRLRQVDVAGTFEFFGPIAVDRTERSTAEEMIVFPNPVKDELYLSANLADDAELSILNISGQVLGSTLFGATKSTGGLDVSKLPSGVYFLRIDGTNETATVRFVKQ